MNKKFAYLLAATLFMTAGPVQAELKMVVLDSVRAILDTEEAAKLIEAANKEMSSEQQALQGLADQMKAIQERLQTDGEVMSESETRKAQKDMEDLRIDLEFGSKKLQKEAQDRRNEILQILAPKFEKVRNDIIQVDQIDFIVQPQALIYANPVHDITRRVTEKMNEQKN